MGGPEIAVPTGAKQWTGHGPPGPIAPATDGSEDLGQGQGQGLVLAKDLSFKVKDLKIVLKDSLRPVPN